MNSFIARVPVAFALAAIGLATIVVTRGEPSALQVPTLPAAISAELTRLYPGWRFARVHPALVDEVVPEEDVRQSPDWVSGDYNRDGRRDYAVRIVRPEPGDSAHLILGFLGSSRGYERSVVEASRHEHLGIFLHTSRRGTRVTDHDKGLMGESTLVLVNDALTIVFNEGAAMTCLYEKRSWRCFVSAD